MTIGELARRAGIAASAIRYYEKAGLLTVPARTSGRRVYDSQGLHQLTIIRFSTGRPRSNDINFSVAVNASYE